MRVLIVIPNLDLGGTQQAMVYLLPELARRGVHCEVAAMLPPYKVGDDLERAGITVHRLKISHRWSIPEAVVELSRLYRNRGYDIIHGKQYFASIYVASLRPLHRSACLVASFHNHEYDYPSARPGWLAARRQIQSWQMRRWIDAFGALSTATREHYQRHLGIPAPTLLPNAIPVDAIRRDPGLDRAEVLAKYGASANEMVVVVPNRLTHEKGQLYLLRALALLRSHGLRPKALLLGRGPMHAELRAEAARLELSDQVVMPGEQVPNFEFRRVMSAADVVAVPSTFEAFGLVPAEAMALGAPVVASRTGGLTDLIVDGESGLLVPPRQPEPLAKALAQLLTDEPLRNRIAAGGRRRVETEFSVSRVAEIFERFYREALAVRRTSPRSFV